MDKFLNAMKEVAPRLIQKHDHSWRICVPKVVDTFGKIGLWVVLEFARNANIIAAVEGREALIEVLKNEYHFTVIEEDDYNTFLVAPKGDST